MEETLKQKPTGLVSVRRIKEISFFINEKLSKPDITQIKSQLEARLGFNATLNLVNLILRAYYIYEEFPEEIVMEISVENVFEVANLIEFIPVGTDVTTDQMNIPSRVLVEMVAISISHTRALFGKAISGTTMDSTYLPITDPIAASKVFFGEKIKDEELK